MAAVPQVRISATDRRDQILEVATRLFARQGYEGTTTRKIAIEARVNEALVFRHFPSKEELYWAVIERKIQQATTSHLMQGRLDAGGDELAMFSGIAFDILDARARDDTLSRLLLFTALENHKLSQRFFRRYAAEYYERLADYIRRRMTEGAFRQMDPLLAARAFLGMVGYHSWIQEVFGGKRYQDFDLKVVSRTLAAIWLQGMRAEEFASAAVVATSKKNGHAVASHRRNGHSKKAERE